jgi:hypothetical protein
MACIGVVIPVICVAPITHQHLIFRLFFIVCEAKTQDKQASDDVNQSSSTIIIITKHHKGCCVTRVIVCVCVCFAPETYCKVEYREERKKKKREKTKFNQTKFDVIDAQKDSRTKHIVNNK